MPDEHRGFILSPSYRLERGRPVVHLWGKLADGRSFLVRDRGQVPAFWIAAADAKRARELGAARVVPDRRRTLSGLPTARVELARPGDTPALRERLRSGGVRVWEADVPFARRFLVDRGIRGGVAIRGEPARRRRESRRDGAGASDPGVDLVFEDPELAPAGLAPPLTVLSFDIETDPRAARLLSIALHCYVPGGMLDAAAGGEAADDETAGLAAARRFAATPPEVLLVTPPGYSCPPRATAVADERELLAAFTERVARLDPDVLTGWNVVDFDLPVLARRAGELGVPFEIGRGRGALHRRPSGRGSSRVTLPGRLVLDGLDLVRGAFVRLEEYSLDAVARSLLGHGKTLGHGGAAGAAGGEAEGRGAAEPEGSESSEEREEAGDPGEPGEPDDPEDAEGSGDDADGAAAPAGLGKAAAILHAFETDRERFVEYNATDARLVVEILEHLHLIELAAERSRLTGLPPDRVAGSIAAFDFLYLSELHRRGIVAPSVEPPPEGGSGAAGGHVMEPSPGLYERVVVLDFKSLYPSLIRTFNIDPLGYLARAASPGAPVPGAGAAGNTAADEESPSRGAAAEGEDPIVAPNGAAFRREPGILPALLDDLFPRREAAKRRGDRVASYAIKILMNSFYGVLGTPACRFYEPRIAGAVTAFGREALLWSRDALEGWGLEVLYGDTDSLFVASGEPDVAAARRRGEALAERLTAALGRWVEERWGVESRLEIEFERLYSKLLLPELRGGGAGARKRYAGLVEEGGSPRVTFTGMEVVRSDWTELARRLQRELYERLFFDRPVADYLARVVAELRAGRHDGELVYRKVLRKAPSEYTASTPPHVVAARKMRSPPGRRRRVAYVVTTAGPEPAGERRHPIDHEHYVDRQVRPVAEPVLALLGLDFRKVVGDDRQMELF